MKLGASLIVLLTLAATVVGCSAVPNMDAGSAGCQNAAGIGVESNDAPEVLAVVRGLSAADAATKLEAKGHTVVFNTGGDCWCTPPPGGRVTDAWFGQRRCPVALGGWR